MGRFAKKRFLKVVSIVVPVKRIVLCAAGFGILILGLTAVGFLRASLNFEASSSDGSLKEKD